MVWSTAKGDLEPRAEVRKGTAVRSPTLPRCQTCSLYSAVQKSGQFDVALQRQFRPALHPGATPFALPKSGSLARRSRFGAYATERRIALLACDVTMLRCNIPGPPSSDWRWGEFSQPRKATMKVGQRVRFKSTSAARYWKIPQDAQGTVMCSYRLLANNRAAPDRLDVRFTPQLVIWGGAAEDFEEIRDDPERPMQ